MIRLNGKEYSGYVAEADDSKLSVIVHTVELFDDVTAAMADAQEVVEFKDETETVYHVTRPLAARIVTKGIYFLEFSTKPSYRHEMEAKIQEQSDAIDDLLVLILEG